MTGTALPPRGSDRLPSLEHATVADVMHPGVVSCDAETDLVTVARTMATHHIHSVLVNGDDGGWSLLTDIDLVEARATARYAEAGQVAATEVVTITAGEALERAAQIMVEHRLSHLLVVGADGRPAGVLSTLDLAGAIAWGEG